MASNAARSGVGSQESGDRLPTPDSQLPRILSAPWRKVLADLWASKTRTILAVLSIAIGVYAVGSVRGTFVILNHDLDEGYRAANPADGTVYAWPNFDEELLTTVRRVPGVVDVEGIGILSVRARTAPDTWETLTLYAVDDMTRMQVNKLSPDSGDWPVRDHELLIERSSQGLLKLPVGQPLEVELADGKRRTLRVGGVAHDPAGIPATFSGERVGFVTFDTLEWLGGPRNYSRMYVTMSQRESDAQIRAVADVITDRLTRSGRGSYIYTPPAGESPIQSGTNAMSIVLNTLAVLLIFLSMFLIINTVAALLLQSAARSG